MLVLSRKLQEQIKIGEEITVTVLKVKGNTVRVGIEAPKNVRVIRAELPERNPTTDSTDSDAATTDTVADISALADPVSSAAPEEPAQRPQGPQIIPSAMLLSLRRLRKRRVGAPLQSVVAVCASLAK